MRQASFYKAMYHNKALFVVVRNGKLTRKHGESLLREYVSEYVKREHTPERIREREAAFRELDRIFNDDTPVVYIATNAA